MISKNSGKYKTNFVLILCKATFYPLQIQIYFNQNQYHFFIGDDRMVSHGFKRNHPPRITLDLVFFCKMIPIHLGS